MFRYLTVAFFIFHFSLVCASQDNISENVFNILAGHIASQRGYEEEALGYYLKSAKLTQDSRVASLAFKSALELNNIQALQKAADRHKNVSSDQTEINLYLAIVELKKDNLEEAKKHLENYVRLINKSSDENEGYSQAAIILTNINMSDQSLDVLLTLTQEIEESADTWLAKAIIFVDMGNVEKALFAFKKTATFRPDWELFQNSFNLFISALYQINKVAAIDALESFIEDQPLNIQLKLTYASLLSASDQDIEALVVLRIIISQEPKNVQALDMLAALYFQNEDMEQAEEYLSKLQEMNYQSDEFNFFMGHMEVKKEDLDKAIYYLSKVRGQLQLQAMIDMASIYILQKKYDSMHQSMETLRDSHKELALQIYLVEVNVLFDAHFYKRAMELCNEALEKYSQNLDLRFLRGHIAIYLDRPDIMEQDFNTIIMADPDNAQNLNSIGYILADKTILLEKAMVYIQKALKLEPDNDNILDSMGWVLYKMGKPTLALEYLEKALDLAPSNQEYKIHYEEILKNLP